VARQLARAGDVGLGVARIWSYFINAPTYAWPLPTWPTVVALANVPAPKHSSSSPLRERVSETHFVPAIFTTPGSSFAAAAALASASSRA